MTRVGVSVLNLGNDLVSKVVKMTSAAYAKACRWVGSLCSRRRYTGRRRGYVVLRNGFGSLRTADARRNSHLGDTVEDMHLSATQASSGLFHSV